MIVSSALIGILSVFCLFLVALLFLYLIVKNHHTLAFWVVILSYIIFITGLLVISQSPSVLIVKNSDTIEVKRYVFFSSFIYEFKWGESIRIIPDKDTKSIILNDMQKKAVMIESVFYVVNNDVQWESYKPESIIVPAQTVYYFDHPIEGSAQKRESIPYEKWIEKDYEVQYYLLLEEARSGEL